MTEGTPIQQISHFDDYCWIDFRKDSSREFNSVDELKDFFITNFPKIASYILFGNGYYLKKDTQEDLHTRVLTLNMLFKVKQKTIVKSKLVDGITYLRLIDLWELCEDFIPVFSKETFKPMNYLLKRNEFNTWVGFKAETQSTEDVNMNVVQPILDFIFEVIANGKEENFKYIISWLSHIVCKPYKKTEVALFLHSNEKGTGKGTLGYWLKNYLFGSHISNVISGLSKLTQKHNTCIQKKIFTMVEEMPSLQGEFHAQFDAMKHIITDPQITIEPKGIDAFEIPNFANFMLLSNNLMSIKLERGDRRYACFEVSAHKKGDEEYWDHLHDEVLTEETAKEFFKYLKNLDDSEKVSLRKIPKTKLRQTLIDNSIPVHEQFFDDIKKNDYSLPEGSFIPPFMYKGEEITGAIQIDTLYHCYDNYCNNRKEKALRQRLFFNSIEKFTEKHRTTTKDRKTLRFFTLK